MSILELKDISYQYKGVGNKVVLRNISAQFEEGIFYVIIGVSGSGKTTLLSLLAGLDAVQQGELNFQKEKIDRHNLSKHRQKHISLVFQNYNLIDYMTPYENMKLIDMKADRTILTSLGLNEDEIDRNVLQLSGGQQQRAALARALASDAPIILADEPTGNLDDETAEDIIAILKESAHIHQKTVIVVTHSKQMARAADVILRLKGGELYELS